MRACVGVVGQEVCACMWVGVNAKWWGGWRRGAKWEEACSGHMMLIISGPPHIMATSTGTCTTGHGHLHGHLHHRSWSPPQAPAPQVMATCPPPWAPTPPTYTSAAPQVLPLSCGLHTLVLRGCDLVDNTVCTGREGGGVEGGRVDNTVCTGR